VGILCLLGFGRLELAQFGERRHQLVIKGKGALAVRPLGSSTRTL
jgi:hypothetical protein